jgi:hypothetical protein
MTLKKVKAAATKRFLEDGSSKERLALLSKSRNRLDTRLLLSSLEEPEDNDPLEALDFLLQEADY